MYSFGVSDVLVYDTRHTHCQYVYYIQYATPFGPPLPVLQLDTVKRMFSLKYLGMKAA